MKHGQLGILVTPTSPAHLRPLSPHRRLPADVVHSHGHILHHVETLASHCDGPAAAVETASPISPPAAQGVRAARRGQGLGFT